MAAAGPHKVVQSDALAACLAGRYTSVLGQSLAFGKLVTQQAPVTGRRLATPQTLVLQGCLLVQHSTIPKSY